LAQQENAKGAKKLQDYNRPVCVKKPNRINDNDDTPPSGPKLDPQITEILTAKIQKSTAKANKANKANKEDKIREQ
jgi:hypothetical protein